MGLIIEINRLSSLIIALLGRQVLYATVLFVIIAALIKAFRLRSPYWHLGLWTLVLIRLVLPPELSSPISGRALLEQIIPSDAYEQIAQFFSPAMYSVPEKISFEQQVPLRSEPPAARPSWQTILLACWILGMGGCGELYLRKRSRYRKLIRKALPVQDAEFQALVRECCAQFHVTRPVRVVSSDQCVSPFTFGVFQPAIYVPQHLIHTENMTALYAIIAHELIHIKRYDTIWMSLQNVLQIIYFFFPVSWYANRQIELARECICDRSVVSDGKISTTQYGFSLLMVLKFCFTKQEPLQFLPSFNAQYRNLKARIQRLKIYAQQKKPHMCVMYASLLALSVIAMPMGPERLKIRFFTPFQEADRYLFETFQQRLVKLYADAYSPTLTTMRYTGIGLQGEFGEPVYAIGKGQVVRITGEAPHVEVVIAHKLSRRTTVFSVYAHVADVRVHVDDWVTEETPIARLLTREEYGKIGVSEQQHLHLELRQTLDAYRSRSPHYFKYETPETLEAGFYNPVVFYRKHLQ